MKETYEEKCAHRGEEGDSERIPTRHSVCFFPFGPRLVYSFASKSGC